MKRSTLGTTTSAPPPRPGKAEQLVARTLQRVSAVSAVAHPSDDEIATMLAIEAARRRQRAEEIGLRSYLDPLDRPSGVKPGNVNKNFLTATIRSVETHNRREEEADCWRTYEQQKVAERLRGRRDHTPDGRHKPRRRRSRSRSRSQSPSRLRRRSCSRSQSPQRAMRTHAHRHSKERETFARPRATSNSPSPRPLKPTPARVIAPSPPIRRQMPGAWPRGVAMSDDEGELALAPETSEEGDGRSKKCEHEASSRSGSGQEQTVNKKRKKEKREKKEKKRRRKEEKKTKKAKKKGDK